MKKYKEFIAAISIILKANGFTKTGETYYLFKDGNWGVLNFQKSKNANKDIVLFTINLGVFCTEISNAMQVSEVKRGKPDIDDCHWKKRIGFLLPKHEDHWWKIESSIPIEKLLIEIEQLILQTAIPEINNHILIDSLLQEWLSGIGEGITRFQRLVYLSTLLRLQNDPKASQIINDLLQYSKQKPFEYASIEHAKHLGLYE